jgi:hypothetical protein
MPRSTHCYRFFRFQFSRKLKLSCALQPSTNKMEVPQTAKQLNLFDF